MSMNVMRKKVTMLKVTIWEDGFGDSIEERLRWTEALEQWT